MSYQFEIINQINFNNYQKYTFPRYRNVFADSDAGERYFGIGVFNEESPVGLILGKPNLNYPENMMVVSIYIVEEHQRKGLATMLFQRFEAEMKAQGYRSVEIWYINNRESIEYIEKIMKRLGWTQPEVREQIYKCGINNLNHEWINRYKIRRPFSYCNYLELSLFEKNHLTEGCNVWYYQGLSPFIEEEKINPETTLFLKYQGEIIGWNGTFRASAETIAYRSVFIKKEFWGTGAIIPLLLTAIRIHCEMIDKFPYAAFQVSLENKAMGKIITKGIGRGFISITDRLVSYKILQPF